MIDEFELFKVIRPMIGDNDMNEYGIPIMKKVTSNDIDLNTLKPINIQNVTCYHDNSKKIGLLFNYDNKLMKYWNEPMKYIPIIQTLGAICTPDFSVYSSMDKHMIQHSVYMNRWLGCFWASCDCVVIPTIQWATEETFDVCLSAVEEGSIVAISTLGCNSNKEDFLKGFNEMKRRIKPEIIIVYGKIIDGMTGTFVNYDYKDGFQEKENHFRQEQLFIPSNIFEIKDGDEYGK